jgi:PAS domain S-box-containing protein
MSLVVQDHERTGIWPGLGGLISRGFTWRWSDLWQASGVAVVYLITAWLGSLLRLPDGGSSPFWPASGIALAGMIILAPRIWPGILIGAVLINLPFTRPSFTGFLMAAGIGVGNTFEPVAAYLLLRKWNHGIGPLDRPGQVMRFVVASAAACSVAAFNGGLALVLAGMIPASDWWSTSYTWWLGDLAGVLLLTLPIWAWWQRPRLGLSRGRTLELGALVAITALTAELLFGGWLTSPLVSRPFVFILPILFWAAYRFSPREVSSLTLIVAGVATANVWLYLHVPAPLTRFDFTTYFPFLAPGVGANGAMLILQAFICALTLSANLLAAAIEERSATEHALRQSEERWRLAVEAAPNGMVMIASDGIIVLTNAQLAKMFGYGAGELIGQSIDILVPARFRASHPEHRARFFASPTARSMGAGTDLFAVRKDGSEFPVEVGLNPLHTEAGLLVLASIIDISERQQKEIAERRLAEGLRKAHGELEAKVQERTAELTQLNARLQQSLGEKGTLLREIHHRVKNNLQVISSLLQLQAQHTSDPRTLEMFRESRNRVRSMALVHERLYQSPDLHDVDFTAYIRGLADHLLRTYQVDTDLIKLHFDIGEVHLRIDTAVPCGLIVNELMSNCLKHAFPDGRGEIRVGLRATTARRVLLSVSDNGIGLPSDVPEAEGFGLGLISALVQQLQGWLEVERRGGTSFTISFPAEDGSP